MAVRAFLPERMFVNGASPMTLTRASRRKSRQNPGDGGLAPVRALGGAGLVLNPRIARSWAGTGVDMEGVGKGTGKFLSVNVGGKQGQ